MKDKTVTIREKLQATISITDYLLKTGYTATKNRSVVNGRNFSSPFRTDKHPSFRVSNCGKLWFDFSEEEGGDLISLYQKLHSVSVKEAINCLFQELEYDRELYSYKANKLPEHKVFNSNSFDISCLKKNHPLSQNEFLLTKARERFIVDSLSDKYLRAIYYDKNGQKTSNGKYFFQIGFPNMLGGYELWNRDSQRVYKSLIGAKFASFIEGDNPNDVDIFEGMFDFLSHLTITNRLKPFNNTFILNGTGNLGAILRLLRQYNSINSYVDNDTGGDRVHSIFEKLGIRFYDKRKVFEHHNDYNDFLVSMRSHDVSRIKSSGRPLDISKSIFKVLVIFNKEKNTGPRENWPYYSKDEKVDKEAVNRVQIGWSNQDFLFNFKCLSDMYNIVRKKIDEGEYKFAIVYANNIKSLPQGVELFKIN